MGLPLVSVVIPAYNGERYICQAIESVLQQTYRAFEIIVINDGSTDGTAQVLHPYLDKIRYIEQENNGVAAARNRGIEIAQGELIAFLDQDDFFLPDKLAAQASQFEKQTSLGLVNSGWCTVDSEGNLLANVELWHYLPQLNTATWIIWKPVFPGALMLRRAWLERAGGFDTQYQQTSDVDLILRLALMNCPADWVKEVTVCYRQHETNTSRQVVQQVEELETVLKNFFERSDLPDEIRKLGDQSIYQSLVWSAWRLYHSDKRVSFIKYLEKSLNYTPFLRTETILDWVVSFSQFSREQGQKIDVCELAGLPKWNQLINKMNNSLAVKILASTTKEIN